MTYHYSISDENIMNIRRQQKEYEEKKAHEQKIFRDTQGRNSSEMKDVTPKPLLIENDL